MPRHVVVDGSNIATEGRSIPSLRQLNEAVLAYMEEHPDDLITVVVDATFGHRIDPREVPEFDAAVENNELVSPPAGAIGRGDAFVLTIANKANAIILSNDSFQEFHGDYPWLFDGDRLLGGKPVPHVGWVFVPRAPVRGPVSRRAVRDKDHGRASVSSRTHGRPTKAASEPMPVPKTPPPSPRRRRRAEPETAVPDAAPVAEAPAPTPAAPVRATVNELLPFLTFVEEHPIGTTVEGTTESYSSHGAYVTVEDVRAYVPLRYLADPAPRSARDVLSLGESASFVVVSYNPPRRSVDLAKAGLQPPGLVMAPAPIVVSPGTEAELTVSEPIESAPAAAEAEAALVAAAVPGAEPATAPAKKAARRARKAAPVEVVSEPIEPAPVEPEPVPAPAKKAAKRTRKAASAESVAAADPVKKAATRTRKAATKAAAAPAEAAPVPAEPAPAPAKKAAKRTRKTAAAEAAGAKTTRPESVGPEAAGAKATGPEAARPDGAARPDAATEPAEAPAPVPAAKKSRARKRTTPSAEAG
jgi:hypothetical protein